MEIVVPEDTPARFLKLASAYEIDFALANRPIQDQHIEVNSSLGHLCPLSRAFPEIELHDRVTPKYPGHRLQRLSMAAMTRCRSCPPISIKWRFSGKRPWITSAMYSPKAATRSCCSLLCSAKKFR